jgi:hypothetical protein
MRRAVLCVLLAGGIGGTLLHAQPALYDEASVREVRLRFATPRWREVLDSLYLIGPGERLTGDLWIDGVLYPDVGVRFKGYSSHATGRSKNPFNIKLDHVHWKQNHQGFRKLKLSNVTSDPSFLREVLSYAVAREFMPASRANFANLYVNDTLIGLYTNLEAVNKDFVEHWFGQRQNSFFKCNPPTVSLTGENCNLGDSPGTDSTAYMALYDMRSDHGWDHLVELIDVLNNEQERVEEVLNVDRTLWMHAFNHALINFDSYVGYAQNYYLYRDRNGLWNPIVWDLNMAFASFRLTDASTYWNGFTIAQAITMDPLAHHNGFSITPRPLMRELFAVPMYRRMYLAHLRTIIMGWFASGRYYQYAEELRTLIAQHVEADTNRFFSYQDFLDNLDQPVSGITSYPGIAQLMEARTVWLQAYPGFTGQPVIGAPQLADSTVRVGDAVTITAQVEGADTVLLHYRFDPRGVFQRMAMFDDGTHGDGAAGDGVYGAVLTAASNLLDFYLYAENDLAGTFQPERAAHVYHTVSTRIAPSTFVINELVASNGGQVLNEVGRPADWVELFNPGPFTISTAGLHLSDDPTQPTKWPLPLRSVLPGEFLTIWADGREELGELHTSFALDAQGETLVLAYDSATVIDMVSFGPQYPITSWGRYPNGSGTFRELAPTWGTTNQVGLDRGLYDGLRLYPVPASERIFAVVRGSGGFTWQLFRADGRAVTGPAVRSSNDLLPIDLSTFPPGHYVLRVVTDQGTLHGPFIIAP